MGYAIEILEKMHKEKTQKFDFIFVDANKAEYIEYFKYFDDLLDVGGIIVADNILSHYKKTKNYVEALINHPKYRSQILNFEAGMMLSYKVQP